VSARGRRGTWTFACLAFLLAGCKSAPPPKAPDTDSAFEAEIAAEKERDKKKEVPPVAGARSSAPPVAADGLAPPPFTAAQIRAATRNGRTYRYRVEAPGQPPRERVLTFSKVDAEGAELYAGGEPKHVAWTELQKDAEFPKERVTVREDAVKLPGGKFKCIVYEVQGAAGETATYFFAKSLPGAPVLFFTEQDGQRTKTTTLLQHIAGSGGRAGGRHGR
jgi:hypothetical protein